MKMVNLKQYLSPSVLSREFQFFLNILVRSGRATIRALDSITQLMVLP